MERIDMALKVEQFSTTEFYMDGKTLGRRIYNADGTLLVDKWAVIGEEKDDVSMVDDSPAKVGFYSPVGVCTDVGRVRLIINSPVEVA
jgi:hypothetical protein